MKIELTYNKGNTRTITDLDSGLRYPGTKEKPISARVSKDIMHGSFVWNAILMSLNIGYGFKIEYLDGI